MPSPLRTFSCFTGDLADCDCDVVVNSSNTRLALGTGVSGRIRELCGGLEYQRAIREALEREHPDGLLPPGESLLAGAGTARRFKAVVHAAVVDYEQPMEPGAVNLVVSTSPTVVEACAFSALAASEAFFRASDIAAPSIAFPLMGSSIGKLSPFASASAICSGNRKYFAWHLRERKEHSAIRRVVLIGPSAESAEAIQAALRKWQLVA